MNFNSIIASILITLLNLTAILPISGKVILFTYCYNKPELIELQYKTFKQFLKDDYELIVVNDADNQSMRETIVATASQYNLKCINIPQEIHNIPYLDRPTEGPLHFVRHQSPCTRNCNVVQYSLDIFDFTDIDFVALLDSDIFLIKNFSISEYVHQHALAGYDRSTEYTGEQHEKSFLWIGLIFMNLNLLNHPHAFNVNCGSIDTVPVDSGGYTNYYLAHAHEPIRYFERYNVSKFICKNCNKKKSYRCNHNSNMLEKSGFDKKTIAFVQNTPLDWGSCSDVLPNITSRRNLEFLLNNTFVHYQGASNYAPKTTSGGDMDQFHIDKTQAFTKYIHEILEAERKKETI